VIEVIEVIEHFRFIVCVVVFIFVIS